MIEFLMHALLQIVKVLFMPFDFALGWLSLFGTIGALIAVGVLTGLLVNLFQKYCSNQALLTRRRADLEKLKALSREAKQAKDAAKVARISGLTSQISSKYALESLKPALFTVPPLCILAMWVGARLSYEPVRPGDVVEVVGTFEDGVSGYTHVLPNEGLVPAGAAIVPIGVAKSSGSEGVAAPQAHWKIRAQKEGDFPLTVRHGSEHYNVVVPVRAKGGQPPEQATVFRTESPTHDQLLYLELMLREPMASAWWNMRMKSLGIYFIAAIVAGVALRWLMGIK